jgi:hypothetical protein
MEKKQRRQDSSQQELFGPGPGREFGKRARKGKSAYVGYYHRQAEGKEKLVKKPARPARKDKHAQKQVERRRCKGECADRGHPRPSLLATNAAAAFSSTPTQTPQRFTDQPVGNTQRPRDATLETRYSPKLYTAIPPRQ